MASAFSHAIAALGLGSFFPRHWTWRFWILGMICSVIPDADVLAFSLGIPYEHVLGHRGFTHSILFALVLAWFISEVFFRPLARFSRLWWGLVLYFFLCTISHAILDALTNGGLGVAFFAPFENSRYFFPWRPVQVSPIGVSQFFSEWGMRVIRSEMIYLVLPSAGLGLIGWSLNRNRKM
jgi:inner membrane protein